MGSRLRSIGGVFGLETVFAATILALAWIATVSTAPCVAGEAAPTEAIYVVTYSAADILSEIQDKRHLSVDDAKDYLRDRVKGPPALQLDMAQPGRAQIDEPQWLDDALVVSANQAGHEQVTAILAALRKFGVVECSISVRFIALSEEQARRAISDTTDSLATAKQDSPLKLRVLDRDGEAKLLKIVESDRQSNILDAPTFTTFDGQSASFSDICRTQYVVGETVLPSGEREPKTQEIAEGTTLQFLPVVEPGDSVRLEFEGTFSRIQNIQGDSRGLGLPAALGWLAAITGTIPFEMIESELAAQTPHLSTRSLACAVSLKPGESLVFGSVKGFAESRTKSFTNDLFGGWLLPKACEVQPADLIVLVRVEPFAPPTPATARVSAEGPSGR